MPRGMSILEITIVLAIGTALTTLGLVSVANILRQSQFNQQRARLALDVREARDQASNSLLAVEIRELSPTQLRVGFGPSCAAIAAPFSTFTYPAINSAGDKGACFDASIVDTANVGAPGRVVDFVPVGGGATSILAVLPDGHLDPDWPGVPDEAAMESSPCDVDHDRNCGDY